MAEICGEKGTLKKMPSGVSVAITLVVLSCLLYFMFVIFAMGPKETAAVVVNIPNSEHQLIIEEYQALRSGEIRFYLRRPGRGDKRIGDGGFNEHVRPTSGGHYELIWEDGAVIVRYPFRGRAVTEKEDWMEVRLSLEP